MGLGWVCLKRQNPGWIDEKIGDGCMKTLILRDNLFFTYEHRRVLEMQLALRLWRDYLSLIITINHTAQGHLIFVKPSSLCEFKIERNFSFGFRWQLWGSC
jgi:hypothetical protein